MLNVSHVFSFLFIALLVLLHNILGLFIFKLKHKPFILFTAYSEAQSYLFTLSFKLRHNYLCQASHRLTASSVFI